MQKNEKKELLHFQRKNGGHIIGIIYVGHFSMWMTMEKSHLMHFKSCIVCCVISILCFLLTQKRN
jgi:accessory gene regulator protein AgrB